MGACDSFNQAPGTDFNLGDAGNPAVLNFDGPNNFLTVGRINLATDSEFIVSAGAAVTSDGPLAFVNAVGTSGALTIDGSLTVLDGLTCDGLSDITVSSTGTLTASAGDITIADATLTNQGTISVTTNTLATTGTGLIANSAGAVVSVGTGIISAAMTTAAAFTLAVTAAASAQVTAALDFGLNAQVTVAAGADVAFAGVVSSADGFIATGATAADQIDFSADVSGSDAVFGSVHATVGAKANYTQSLSIEDGAMFEVASGADLYAPVIDVSDPNSELVVDGTVHLENSLGITETIAGGVVTVTADGVIMVEVADVTIDPPMSGSGELLINTGADLTINGDLTTDNGGFFVTGSGTAEVTFSGDVTGDGLDLSTVVATVATATSVTVDYFASADDVMLTVDGGLTVATAATLSGLVTVSSTGTFVSSALADLDASGRSTSMLAVRLPSPVTLSAPTWAASTRSVALSPLIPSTCRPRSTPTPPRRSTSTARCRLAAPSASWAASPVLPAPPLCSPRRRLPRRSTTFPVRSPWTRSRSTSTRSSWPTALTPAPM